MLKVSFSKQAEPQAKRIELKDEAVPAKSVSPASPPGSTGPSEGMASQYAHKHRVAARDVGCKLCWQLSPLAFLWRPR